MLFRSKIKTFQTKHLHIHRSKPGVIHFDGDPTMSGEDIDVHLEERGIKIIVNPEGNKRVRQPNAIQTAAAELFNEINDLRSNISRQSRRRKVLTRMIQREIEKRLPIF